MEKYFGKSKDADQKILMELDDKSLLSICSTDKYFRRICNDEHFWRNRFVRKYGEKGATHKPKDLSWRKHYLQVIIDLEPYQEDPMSFTLDIIRRNSGTYFKHGELFPIHDNPQDIKNLYYLLDLGENVVIWLEDGFDESDNLRFKKRILSHPTPETLFDMTITENPLEDDIFIDGFDLMTDEDGMTIEGYQPLYTRDLPALPGGDDYIPYLPDMDDHRNLPALPGGDDYLPDMHRNF